MVTDFWGNTHDTLKFSVKPNQLKIMEIFSYKLLDKIRILHVELINLEGDILRRVDLSNEFDFYEFKHLLPGGGIYFDTLR